METAPMSAITAPTNTTTWREAQARALDAMTPAQRQRYEDAGVESAAEIHLSGLVYNARTEAGLTQKQLAALAKTSQSVISEIEGGGQIPTVPMLMRIAHAVGKELKLSIS